MQLHIVLDTSRNKGPLSAYTVIGPYYTLSIKSSRQGKLNLPNLDISDCPINVYPDLHIIPHLSWLVIFDRLLWCLYRDIETDILQRRVVICHASCGVQKELCPMLCTAQLGGPVLKASGRVQNTPFQLGDKPPIITDQLTAGGSVSQLSQLAKLSPW